MSLLGISKNNFVRMVLRSSLAVRLLKGAFWTGLGTVVAKGATVLASFCVARFCGKTQFGEYGMVISTASMLSTVCGLGLGTTVIKYIAQLRARDPDRAGRILAMSTFLTWSMAILFGTIFMLTADWVAIKILVAPHLAGLLRLAAVGVILGIFNEVQLSSLTGCEAYEERAKITVISGIAQALLLSFTSYFFGVQGAVIAFSLAGICTVVLTTWVLVPVWRRFGLRRQFAGMFTEWRVLLSFSLPTLLLLLLGYPVTWFTRILLARIPNGYDHLAIINAAAPWGAAIAFVVQTIGAALVPVFADLIGQGEVKRALRLTWRMFFLNAIIVVPCCGMLCLFAPLILRGYGEGFAVGLVAFCLVILANGVGAVYQPMWNYLVGAGFMWTNFVIVSITALIQIGFAWCLVAYGSVGLAGANLVASLLRLFVLSMLFMCYAKKYCLPVEWIVWRWKKM